MIQLAEHLYLFRSTCNVYILRSGRTAVLIDFGDGAVLEALPAIGVDRVSAILMTHHHRDQGQGLHLAAAAGIPIWAPHQEQDLFQSVDQHWQAREIYNNYNNRQDRFSLLEPIPLAGTLQDYADVDFGGYRLTVQPTPGHTVGSISLLAEIDGRRIAFTGDLISAPGQLWSLAATQWSYNGAEGVAQTILSLLDLADRTPDLLLPSHGAPMEDPASAIDPLVERLRRLLALRGHNLRLLTFRAEPFVQLTPHLLQNRTSMAYSYVLLSESGKALLIDYGYDFATGLAAGADRASRRPWLYNIPALKRQFGVKQVDVVLPTHYHDDHVAGLNLLRAVEGAQVWAADNFADVLRRPAHYDLPCLWYDPIPVDRTLPLEIPFRWEEYELTLHPLPGHTRHGVAVDFTVDGKRVLAIGDQQGSEGFLNYVYKNRYAIGDYERSATLYQRVQPDLMLSGHWDPLWVTPETLTTLAERGAELEQLHRDLLPLHQFDLDAEGAAAWIRPYQSEAAPGASVPLEVEVRNPFGKPAEAVVQLVAPAGWNVEPAERRVEVGARETATVSFQVTPPAGGAVRRARVAADLTVAGARLGQQAEALITVRG